MSSSKRGHSHGPVLRGIWPRWTCGLLKLAASLTMATAAAQSAPETAPVAFDALAQWAGKLEQPLPQAPKTPQLVEPRAEEPGGQAKRPPAKSDRTTAPFEPQPVIIGRPELPLRGPGAGQAAQRWNAQLNYHGLLAQILLQDPRTHQLRPAPMGTQLPRNQPFKIRVTATFDGVTAVDQVLGPDWNAERTGQVYPRPGQSVEVKAGVTVDLPLGEAQYFVMRGRTRQERLLLTLRHASAKGPQRSAQPAYREDDGRGSLYLQLVPPGQYPAIEQLVRVAR